MKRLALCLLGLVLAACSGSPKSIAARPSATPQGSVSASASGHASSSPASLACRLPIVEYTQEAQGLVPSHGFLTLPGGQFVADPTGMNETGSYDWPMRRWVPVELRNVSPDGLHYAYERSGAIHDVEVASGTDRAFTAPTSLETILYYAKEGIYFQHGGVGPPTPGLWLLDPATGKTQTVFNDKSVDAVGGFAAWLPHVNRADPKPLHSSFSGGTFPNEALRQDLNGGGTVSWFYQPGKFLTVVGFDVDRRPLIVVSNGESVPTINEIWLVPSANKGQKIYTGMELPRIVGDAPGIWMSDKRGIWLYTTSQGLVRISLIVADVAGKCQ